MAKKRTPLSQQLRAQLAASTQPELSDELPGLPCPVPLCKRLVNCDECAERRAEIDRLAEHPPRSAGEIREDIRRGCFRNP